MFEYFYTSAIDFKASDLLGLLELCLQVEGRGRGGEEEGEKKKKKKREGEREGERRGGERERVEGEGREATIDFKASDLLGLLELCLQVEGRGRGGEEEGEKKKKKKRERGRGRGRGEEGRGRGWKERGGKQPSISRPQISLVS